MVMRRPRVLRVQLNDRHCVRSPASLNSALFCIDQSRNIAKPRSPQSSRSIARPMLTQMVCAWPNFSFSAFSLTGIALSAERKRVSSAKLHVSFLSVLLSALSLLVLLPAAVSKLGLPCFGLLSPAAMPLILSPIGGSLLQSAI